MSTRTRVYGAELETPFGKWLRAQTADLDAASHGFAPTDVDMHIHKYKDNCDGLGPRQVQLMMAIEVKTRGGMPNRNQQQTLFFLHQILGRWRGGLMCSMDGGKKSVWHFGYYVLSLFEDQPKDYVTWCQFDKAGRLRDGRTIAIEHLIRILRFDVYPNKIDKALTLRRHHKVSRVVEIKTAPLGFDYEQIVTRRS